MFVHVRSRRLHGVALMGSGYTFLVMSTDGWVCAVPQAVLRVTRVGKNGPGGKLHTDGLMTRRKRVVATVLMCNYTRTLPGVMCIASPIESCLCGFFSVAHRSNSCVCCQYVLPVLCVDTWHPCCSRCG